MSESGSFSRAMPFAGRVAIVTGAASGIGLATVELLHRQGARIVAVGRGDNVNALAREGIVPVVADVTQEASADCNRTVRSPRRLNQQRWHHHQPAGGRNDAQGMEPGHGC